MPKPSSSRPPVYEITFTITQFKDLIHGPWKKGTLSEFEMTAGTPPCAGCQFQVGTFQDPGSPPQTIQVCESGVTLRFIFQGSPTAAGDYQPVGIAFARADGTRPAAAYWGIGRTAVPGSPFRIVGRDTGVLEVVDIPILRLSGLHPETKARVPRPPYITYKFSVLIQRENDGAIGLIDPYIENVN